MTEKLVLANIFFHGCRYFYHYWLFTFHSLVQLERDRYFYWGGGGTFFVKKLFASCSLLKKLSASKL